MKNENSERHDELLRLIKTEESTIGKIRTDIDKLNEMIDKTEGNLKKIMDLVTSLREKH